MVFGGGKGNAPSKDGPPHQHTYGAVAESDTVTLLSSEHYHGGSSSGEESDEGGTLLLHTAENCYQRAPLLPHFQADKRWVLKKIKLGFQVGIRHCAINCKIYVTPKCVCLPISKLRWFLAVANLLAHNNISQICYCGQISLEILQFFWQSDTFGGDIYLAGDGSSWNLQVDWDLVN